MAKILTIPRPSMVYVEAKLVGVPPGLLLHPFDQKAETMLLASMQKGRARLTKPDKDPDKDFQEAEASLRVGRDKGTYWINALAFKLAMIRGAKFVDKLPMTDVRAGVFVDVDSIIHGVPAAHIKGTAVKDSRHAANKGGAPDYRTRVVLPEWEYTLRFKVTTTILSVEQALTCLVNGGEGVGVGDYRPEKNGVHGRWEVTECVARNMEADNGKPTKSRAKRRAS